MIGLKDTLLTRRILKAEGMSFPNRRLDDHDLDPVPDSPFADSFSIENEGRTINFDFRTGGRMDQMRIITAVPEPGGLPVGSMLLLGHYWLSDQEKCRDRVSKTDW